MTAAPTGRLTRVPAERPSPILALAFGAGAYFLIYLGQVMLGVIQPQVQADLGLDHDQAQWLLNGLMLGLAALVPLGGRLADIVAPRETILIGLVLMALGDLGAALAGSFVPLVLCLGLQGAGAGVAIAATVAIVAGAYPAAERGRAIGIYGALGVSALAIGAIIAGALVQDGHWRLTFWFALALTLAVIGLGLAALPRDERRAGQTVDVPGAVLSIVGITLLLGGAVQAAAWGWTAPATLFAFAAGAISLVAFTALQIRRAEPLVDLTLLRSRTLACAGGCLFLVQFAINCFAIYVPIYLVTLAGLGPLPTGLALLAALALPPLISKTAGDMVDRVGHHGPAIVSTLLMAAGFAWIAALAPGKEYPPLIPGFVLIGVGVPIAIVSLLEAGASTAPADERGATAGVLNSARWIGATVGTVSFGVALTAVRLARMESLLAPDHLSAAQSAQVEHLVLSDEDAQRAAVHDLGKSVIDAVSDSFAAGYSAGLWICCGMLILSVALAAWGLRARAIP
jgi:EmrB/QacA subfamily drug resistance transporter